MGEFCLRGERGNFFLVERELFFLEGNFWVRRGGNLFLGERGRAGGEEGTLFLGGRERYFLGVNLFLGEEDFV